MFPAIMLIIMIIGAVICYLIAGRNDMSTIFYPMVGFIVPVIGTVLVVIFALLKGRKAEKSAADDEGVAADTADGVPDETADATQARSTS
ncbi:hypothetical protein N9D66_01830 [Candidatus Nanopelagicales bacterium]|nr:hypothetical protein [Candidatus Nanopelagicales bacterium]